MYKTETKLLPSGHRLRPGGRFKKTSITIHSTGNPASSPESERKWLENSTNKRDAAWHYVVGEGIVIQAIPENEIAWHCGKAEGNNHSIGVEIVESGDRLKVLNTAAEFVSVLLKKYGWGTDRLKTHHDWTGKNCPRILIDKSCIKNNLNWQWFIETVKAFLAEETETKPKKAVIIVDGKECEARSVNINGTTYWAIRDIAPLMRYDVDNRGTTPLLTKK